MDLFDLFNFAKDLVSKFGYPGVFMGTFLESIFPPIPSEVVLGFSGFLISEGRFEWLPTIFAAVLGNALSVSLIWFLGRRFGKNFLLKFGGFVGFTQKEFDFGEKLFHKHGYKMVFFCQMLPMARTLIAIPAGVLKTTYWKFILANSLGATIWFSILAMVGYYFGENWTQIETVFKPFERVIIVLIIFIFGFLAYKWYKSKELSKVND
jgi:membrane protein DedA with SNARE-associated domain